MNRTFILDLGLFEERCGSIEWSEKIIRPLLEILAYANAQVLACGMIPPLYRSGVRYMQEPPDKEIFSAIPQVLARGGGDCDDLAAWRVAELRKAGEPAQYRILKFESNDGRLTYHIQVRRKIKSFLGWIDGPVEDPSQILGMKGSA